MPFGDKTGPEGRGSMTGRRAGYCAGNDRPGSYESSGFGRGRGGGRGQSGGRFTDRFMGRNRRNFSYEQESFTAPDEATILQSQSTWLKEQLDYISGRLDAVLKARGKED